jgi:hypothetical protein
VESAECRLSWTTIRQGTPRCTEKSGDTGREDEVVVDSAVARTKADFESWWLGGSRLKPGLEEQVCLPYYCRSNCASSHDQPG